MTTVMFAFDCLGLSVFHGVVKRAVSLFTGNRNLQTLGPAGQTAEAH